MKFIRFCDIIAYNKRVIFLFSKLYGILRTSWIKKNNNFCYDWRGAMNKEIERKKYEIQLNIENEEQLYNSFDKFNNTLSDDVYSYINNRIEFTNITDKIEIKINSNEKIDSDHFIQVYNAYIDEQLKLAQKESKFNTTKQIWLLGIGILFIIFSLLFSEKINVIVLEIISTIGSFSIWESANSWLIERKIIKGKKIRLRRLKNAEIKFE